MSDDVAADVIHFYWRPGCGFCARLYDALERRGIEVVEHNIWESDADASVVRRFANGNETVPTLVIGDTGFVNPSPDTIVEHLGQHAPHLLPTSG